MSNPSSTGSVDPQIRFGNTDPYGASEGGAATNDRRPQDRTRANEGTAAVPIMPQANKQALLDLLTVERHAPGPRPPRMVASCDPPASVTPEQAAEHRRVLLDAISGDGVVVAFRESA